VLGRALRPQADSAGHELIAPGHSELDLFDPAAVAEAVRAADAVLHLATRIMPLDQVGNPDAWRENDRLRTVAARNLVDAALGAEVGVFVQPTIAFIYAEDGPTSEDTPLGELLQPARSAIVAEEETDRFAQGPGRGVVLRLGLLDGPGTGRDEPMRSIGASLHVADAAHALLTALELPSGIYNVCRDGERVTNARFTRAAGWHPEH
jgi:nucleoside-diphosphate-sugar epimerase